jgi:hypothetical protein
MVGNLSMSHRVESTPHMDKTQGGRDRDGSGIFHGYGLLFPTKQLLWLLGEHTHTHTHTYIHMHTQNLIKVKPIMTSLTSCHHQVKKSH